MSPITPAPGVSRWTAAWLVAVVVVMICSGTSVKGATTIRVNAGGDLQAALNAAQPGDEIVLQAGAKFTGAFILPRKPEGPVITIRSSATLPSRRVTPDDAALMPIIGSGSAAPAIEGPCARNWRFDGLRFESTASGLYNIIYTHNLKNPDGTFCNTNNVSFDRILIVAGVDGQRRGIAGNGGNTSLTRSHIANIRERGGETAAFGAWDGPGPFTLRDNYLEAAGMSVLFGGADSSSPNHVPSDIVVENNHMTKRLEWKGQYTVKNVFELKSAKRVTIRNNLFERSWTDAQTGYAILFTVHNDGGGSPWACIEDVVFENNIVREAERGINILGNGYVYPSGRGTRITIRNNLVITASNGFMVGGEVGELTIDHNTFVNAGGLGVLYRGRLWRNGEPAVRDALFAIEKLTMTNNLAYHNESGLFGDEVGSGTPALTAHVKAWLWTNNVLAARTTPYSYPSITWFPTKAEHDAQFNANYTLVANSTYRGAGTDKKDLGWNGGTTALVLPPASPRNVRIN